MLCQVHRGFGHILRYGPRLEHPMLCRSLTPFLLSLGQCNSDERLLPERVCEAVAATRSVNRVKL